MGSDWMGEYMSFGIKFPVMMWCQHLKKDCVSNHIDGNEAIWSESSGWCRQKYPSDEKHTGGKDAWEGFEKKCFFKEKVGEGKQYF